MFTLKKTLSIVSMAVLFLVACTPEDGDTGPAGPVGPEGPIGPAGQGDPGQDGQDGVDGRDGVANINVANYTVVAADFVGTQIKNDTIDAVEVTNEILVNGDIQSFLSFNSSSTVWHPMPYREVVFTGPTTVAFENITISYSVGKIYLTQFTDQLTVLPIRDFTLKLVTIPPSSKIADFEPKTFEELQMVYGLKE